MHGKSSDVVTVQITIPLVAFWISLSICPQGPGVCFSIMRAFLSIIFSYFIILALRSPVVAAAVAEAVAVAVAVIHSDHLAASNAATAAGVQSIISIASVSTIETGAPIFDLDMSNPAVAISDNVQAPYQRQIRRERSSSTS